MRRILVAELTTARLTFAPEPEPEDFADLPGHSCLLSNFVGPCHAAGVGGALPGDAGRRVHSGAHIFVRALVRRLHRSC